MSLTDNTDGILVTMVIITRIAIGNVHKVRDLREVVWEMGVDIVDLWVGWVVRIKPFWSKEFFQSEFVAMVEGILEGGKGHCLEMDIGGWDVRG